MFQSTPFPRRATYDYQDHVEIAEVSIHALPAKGDGIHRVDGRRALRVSIHALPAKGDLSTGALARGLNSFNPRPSREGRLDGNVRRLWNTVFQSTPFPRRATGKFYKADFVILEFQSTPFPRRATPTSRVHALRASVSIHALPAKGDPPDLGDTVYINGFQSTPFPRRATLLILLMESTSICFNPRPSREGRQRLIVIRRIVGGFNPRPSREGRQSLTLFTGNLREFQSTPFPRRATGDCSAQESVGIKVSIHALPAKGDERLTIEPQPDTVSIHALPAKGDSAGAKAPARFGGFNPRPSREGRPVCSGLGAPLDRFQSTPFPRRATRAPELRTDCRKFQSTPFPRRATGRLLNEVIFTNVSIHALPAKGDPSGRARLPRSSVSIHALPAKGDPFPSRPSQCPYCFNPRPSREGRPSPSLTGGCSTGFQSTPFPRRATGAALRQPQLQNRFNPRPSREGRRPLEKEPQATQDVSIHALPAKGDGQQSKHYRHH